MILIAVLCFATSNTAMEILRKGDGNIKYERDIAPFVCKVVAYEFCCDELSKERSLWSETIGDKATDSPYYHFKGNPNIYYAYVENKGELFFNGSLERENLYYRVHTLLQLPEPCTCSVEFKNTNCCSISLKVALAGSNSSKSLYCDYFNGDITMRDITQEEALDILNVISIEVAARFSYWDSPKCSLPNIVGFLHQLACEG